MQSNEDELIVISTNNYNNIEETLGKVDEVNKRLRGVLLVDTYSNNRDYENLCIEKCNQYGFMWRKSDYPDYEFSGVATAKKYYARKKYFFQQDSIFPIEDAAYDTMFENIKDNAPVVWCKFERSVCPWGWEEVEKFCRDVVGGTDYDIGVFGNIFGITYEDLLKISELNNIEGKVKNKSASCGMERGWAILFKKYGMLPEYLTNYPPQPIYFQKRFNERS